MNNASSPPTILVVENHDLVRDSLRIWLSLALPWCRLQAASSGEEALALTLSHPCELVLIDSDLPLMNGIEATRRIKATIPETLVVMLATEEARQYAVDALAAGATCYVFKRRMHVELIPTLVALLSSRKTDDPALDGLPQ